MIKKGLISLALIAILLPIQSCIAEVSTTEDFDKYTVNLLDPSLKVSQIAVNYNITTSNIEAFNEFLKATDRFKQSNVEAAYEDFKFIIDNIETNDFGYTLMAGKLADYGFFYLSHLASQKMSDKDITQNHVDNMELFYYPKKRLPLNEELYLAEAYSNIMFNEQSKETMNELLANQEILKKYDYANYILALAAYKSNNLQLANQYIKVAILKNPKNLNYKILQAQILANGMKPKDALKIVNDIKNEKLYEAELVRRVNSIEQYVLYKNAKKDWSKNYHLGYYYYYEGDFNKAIKSLQNGMGKNKKRNAQMESLLSKIYLSMQEYEKAKVSAQKAIRKLGDNTQAYYTLGNLYSLQGNNKKAKHYYKTALKNKELENKATIKIAQIEQQSGQEIKAKNMFEKILKNSSSEYEAYYSVALLEPFKELTYLKKALGINIMYTNAWLALARYEIGRDNFAMAQDYLSNVFYIDQNDFRYYYYQGLIYKSQDDIQTAKLFFKKSVKLNPNCVEAQKELGL